MLRARLPPSPSGSPQAPGQQRRAVGPWTVFCMARKRLMSVRLFSGVGPKGYGRF